VPLIHPIQRRHNKPPANGNRRPAERKRDETESLIVRHPWATCFSCAARIKALMRRRQRGRKAGGPDFPSSEKMPPNLDRQRTGSTGLGTIWRGGYESGATVGGTGTEEWKQMWGKRYRQARFHVSHLRLNARANQPRPAAALALKGAKFRPASTSSGTGLWLLGPSRLGYATARLMPTQG
jgi:hypothetical protein